MIAPIHKDGDHWITLVYRDYEWYLFDSRPTAIDNTPDLALVMFIVGSRMNSDFVSYDVNKL